MIITIMWPTIVYQLSWYPTIENHNTTLGHQKSSTNKKIIKKDVLST